MNNKETWKDVVGYEGFYKVSDKGNIKSVERLDGIGRRCGGLVLRAGEHKHGYLQVRLYKNGRGRHKLIHRLVSKAFIPNPNSFLEVKHIDENKKNNEVANLEWCDTKYNVNYGTRNKRVSRKLSKKVKRKERKHQITRKLRAKAYQMELVKDIAKDAKTNEIKVLDHMKEWLLEVAKDVEDLN